MFVTWKNLSKVPKMVTDKGFTYYQKSSMVGPWFFSKPAYTQLQEILKVDNANTGISADGDDNSATQAPFVTLAPNLQISI